MTDHAFPDYYDPAYWDDQDASDLIEVERGRRAPYTQLGDWILYSLVSNEAKVLYWAICAFHSSGLSATEPVLCQLISLDNPTDLRSYLDELVGIDAIEVTDDRTYVVHEAPPAGYEYPQMEAGE